MEGIGDQQPSIGWRPLSMVVYRWLRHHALCCALSLGAPRSRYHHGFRRTAATAMLAILVVCGVGFGASLRPNSSAADADAPSSPSLAPPVAPKTDSSFFFGALLATNGAAWAQLLQRPDVNGALVLNVVPGSPAASVGIGEGDVIVSIDGVQVENDERASVVFRSVEEPARRVTFTRSDGTLRTVDVHLWTSPDFSIESYSQRLLGERPDPVTAYLFAQQSRDPAIAADVARQVVQAHPQFGEGQALFADRMLQAILAKPSKEPQVQQAALAGVQEIIDSAVRTDQSSSNTQAVGAQVLLLLGRPQDAESLAARARDLDELSGRAHFLLGASRLAMDRPEDALPDLHKAVALNPFQPSYYQALGRCYLQLGKPIEAAKTRASLQTLLNYSRATQATASRATRVGLSIFLEVLVSMVIAVVFGYSKSEERLRSKSFFDSSRIIGITELLAVVGTWSMGVPAVGLAFGFAPQTSSRLEVVDHVLPGLLVVLLSIAMMILLRSGESSGLGFGLLLAPGVVLLAGLWILSSHVPLVAEAIAGRVSWDTAVFHSSPGPPIVAMAIWLCWVLWQSEEKAPNEAATS